MLNGGFAKEDEYEKVLAKEFLILIFHDGEYTTAPLDRQYFERIYQENEEETTIDEKLIKLIKPLIQEILDKDK